MSTLSENPASPALVEIVRPEERHAPPKDRYAKAPAHDRGHIRALHSTKSTLAHLTRQISMANTRGGRALSVSCDWGTREPKISNIEHLGFVRVEKPKRIFCTGSHYTGQWDGIGMSGFGTFIFPHRVEYEGQMKDGMFHGEGTLLYPMGQKMDGEWRDGRLISMKYRFPDGLDYEDPWRYCQYPDRRFYMSVNEGLRPAGKELRTNNDTPRTIPPGCYDVGDGFYDPQTKCVVSPINLKKIIRIPTAAEEYWIVTNCRKAWDEPTGYRPELYSQWFTGRRHDIDSAYTEQYSYSENATL